MKNAREGAGRFKLGKTAAGNVRAHTATHCNTLFVAV